MEPDLTIEEVFASHEPDAHQKMRLSDLRDAARKFAKEIVESCPNGPDKSAALRKVREALMTANAGVMLKGRVFHG